MDKNEQTSLKVLESGAQQGCMLWTFLFFIYLYGMDAIQITVTVKTKKASMF